MQETNERHYDLISANNLKQLTTVCMHFVKFCKLNMRCWQPTLRTLKTLPMSESKGDDVENIPMFFLKKNSSITSRYYIWHYIYALKQNIQVTYLTNHQQMTNTTYHGLSSHVPRITEFHTRNLMLLVGKMT